MREGNECAVFVRAKQLLDYLWVDVEVVVDEGVSHSDDSLPVDAFHRSCVMLRKPLESDICVVRSRIAELFASVQLERRTNVTPKKAEL